MQAGSLLIQKNKKKALFNKLFALFFVWINK